MRKSAVTKYQEGWLAGQSDAKANLPKADVKPGKQAGPGAPVMWCGQARLRNGDAWADGYSHGYEAQLKLAPIPAP